MGRWKTLLALVCFGTIMAVTGCGAEEPTDTVESGEGVAQAPSITATSTDSSSDGMATRRAENLQTQSSQQTVEALTPSATASMTPMPTDTPTATPVLPRSLDGPWFAIAAGHDDQDAGLWVGNADGSAWQQIPSSIDLSGSYAIQHSGAAPDGGLLAFTGYTETGALTLSLLSLPDGVIQPISQLASPEVAADPAHQIMQAIQNRDSQVWSPDGQILAFISAGQGSSADLYIYRPATGVIMHLTSGPTQALNPVWSPDSYLIAHIGVNSFGTGAGHNLDRAWVAAADGSAVIEMYEIVGGGEEILGWVSPDHFVTYSWSVDCGSHGLQLVQVSTRVRTPIWDGNLNYEIAMDPASGTILLAVSDPFEWCGTNALRGVFEITINGNEVSEPSQVWAEGSMWLRWIAEQKLFLFPTDGAWALYPPGGPVLSIDVSPWLVPAVPSGDGPWAWYGNGRHDQSGVWIGKPGDTLHQIETASVFTAAWSPDGQHLVYITTNGDLYVARSPQFTPVLLDADLNLTFPADIVWVQQ